MHQPCDSGYAAPLDEEMKEMEAAHADVSASISEIYGAIQVLKQSSTDVPQSLLEVQDSKLIPVRAKAAVASYLAAAQNMESDEFAPEASTYEYQSGSVVSLLEKLLAKFEDQKLTLEKKDANCISTF
jgi:septal ring factor EnvC (AmiA/AmiB activator)